MIRKKLLDLKPKITPISTNTDTLNRCLEVLPIFEANAHYKIMSKLIQALKDKGFSAYVTENYTIGLEIRRDGDGYREGLRFSLSEKTPSHALESLKEFIKRAQTWVLTENNYEPSHRFVQEIESVLNESDYGMTEKQYKAKRRAIRDHLLALAKELE